MLILAFESSAKAASVALCRDGHLVSQYSQCSGLTHSRTLLPMAEDMLKNAELTIGDIDAFAVAHGPGSFTGVRIGVTAVKALSHALGIPCVAVDALEATAAGLEAQDEIVCPIQDARVQQVYGAAFCNGKRLLDDCVLKLPEYLDKISPLGERFLFTGDGVAVYRQQIADCLGDRVRFAAAPCAYLRPAAVAALAARDADQAVDYLTLQPLYLRAPQAERERAAREGAKHG